MKSFKTMVLEGKKDLIKDLKAGKEIKFKSNGHTLTAKVNQDGDVSVNDGQDLYTGTADFIKEYKKALTEGSLEEALRNAAIAGTLNKKVSSLGKLITISKDTKMKKAFDDMAKEIDSTLVNLRSKVNEDTINEKKDLSKFADTMADLTANNDNMAARLLMATLTENKRLIEVVKAINSIIEFENHNPVSEYTNVVYKKINDEGRKKYGKAEWDKHIYSNN